MENSPAKRHQAHRLSRIALFCALIAVSAQIALPGTPPITLQSFAVLTAALLLSPRDSVTAVFVYISLGAVGVPVFAAFRGGIGHLLSPTGGYLFGFLLSAYAVSRLGRGRRFGRQMLAGAVGMLLCYTVGTLWFVAVSGTDKGLGGALLSCVLPFLLPDAAKLLLAVMLSRRLPRL